MCVYDWYLPTSFVLYSSLFVVVVVVVVCCFPCLTQEILEEDEGNYNALVFTGVANAKMEKIVSPPALNIIFLRFLLLIDCCCSSKYHRRLRLKSGMKRLQKLTSMVHSLGKLLLDCMKRLHRM